MHAVPCYAAILGVCPAMPDQCLLAQANEADRCWVRARKVHVICTFTAIIFVSLADVFLSLYTPTTRIGRVAVVLGTAELAIAGIVLRAVEQGQMDGKQVK